MIEITLNALKFIALAVGGVLGVIAVVGETRKEGKLTHYGALTLIGILASALVGLTIQVFEVVKAKQDAERKERQAHQMVEEIRSPLMPAGRMTVSFSLVLKLDHPKLAAYQHRIEDLLKSLLGSTNPPEPPVDTHWRMDTNQIIGVQFGTRSPFFPTIADGELLPLIFDHFGIEGWVQSKTKDKTLTFYAFPKDGKVTYEYEPTEHLIKFDVRNVELRAGDSFKPDGIVSLQDLSSSTLTVDFIGFDWGSDPEVKLAIDFEKLSTIEFFEFFAANRAYFVAGGSRQKAGEPLIYEFPQNLLEWGVNLPRNAEERAGGPRK